MDNNTQSSSKLYSLHRTFFPITLMTRVAAIIMIAIPIVAPITEPTTTSICWEGVREGGREGEKEGGREGEVCDVKGQHTRWNFARRDKSLVNFNVWVWYKRPFSHCMVPSYPYTEVTWDFCLIRNNIVWRCTYVSPLYSKKKILSI